MAVFIGIIITFIMLVFLQLRYDLRNDLLRACSVVLIVSSFINIVLFHSFFHVSWYGGTGVANRIGQFIYQFVLGPIWQIELFYKMLDRTITIALVIILSLFIFIQLTPPSNSLEKTKRKEHSSLIIWVIMFTSILIIFSQIKPFGETGTYYSPNTTENRYHIKSKFSNRQDVINFIEQKVYPIDNFVKSDGTIDWVQLEKNIKVQKGLIRTIYTLEYRPNTLGANKHYIKVSSDGFISEVWSSGK